MQTIDESRMHCRFVGKDIEKSGATDLIKQGNLFYHSEKKKQYECLRHVTVLSVLFALMALGLAYGKEEPATTPPPPPQTFVDKVKQVAGDASNWCKTNKEALITTGGGVLTGILGYFILNPGGNEDSDQSFRQAMVEGLIAFGTEQAKNVKQKRQEEERNAARHKRRDKPRDDWPRKPKKARERLPIFFLCGIAGLMGLWKIITLFQRLRKPIKGSDTMGSGRQPMKVWPYPGYNPNPVFVDSLGSSIQIRRIGRPIGGISASSIHHLTQADHAKLMQFVKYEHDEFEYDLLQLMGGNVKVSIRADSNGRFLCADNLGSPDSRPVMANRDATSEWETFTIFLNPDSFSLKSNANGKFVSVRVNDGGRMVAEADNIGLCEKFLYARRILDNSNRLLLRSLANGKFVSVDPNTGNVSARADVPREWEWLFIERC